MEVDWELSQALTSDGQGIRGACVLKAETDSGDSYRLITGSQRGSLVDFGVPSGRMNIVEYQHDHAITALLASPDQDFYVTGCKDSIIRVFDATTHQLQYSLTGHEKPVTSLAWCISTTEPYLVSGSWDGSAKVWSLKAQALVATLGGHENSVCVLGLGTDANSARTVLQIVTGSAGVAAGNSVTNHSVRLWQVDPKTGESNMIKKVSNDHDGPIRGLALQESTQLLATCSNDGTVKLRTLNTGECISTLTFVPVQTSSGGAPILLSVASVDSSSLASSAEDGQVVIWETGRDTPSIIHHAVCVWQVISLPDGDLATCCDDGTLRIFTKATERMASQEDRSAFAKDVSDALQKQSKGPTPDEIARLPRWENNAHEGGTSEGQVKVFQKDGTAIAAQWSMASQTWIEVGQVVGNKEGGGAIDGVQYDHVLPIEVDQTGGGVARLQIGYNTGENPFAAAQRFIDSHMLPQHHLSDIADYITQRTGQQGPTLGGPGASSTPPATTGVPIAAFQHLPVKVYKAFELSDKAVSTTLGKMKTKIVEFGKMNENQLHLVGTLMDTLAIRNRYHSSSISDEELGVLASMLEVFPMAEVFPALDLARMTILHPDASGSNRATFWDKFLQEVLILCKKPTDNLEGPAKVGIPMLSLRIFANAFKGGPGSLLAISKYVDGILSSAEQHVRSNNKNIRLSVATTLYNVSCYICSTPTPRSDHIRRIVMMVNDILMARTYEAEATYCVLAALGTVVMTHKEGKVLANSVFLASKVEPAASPHSDAAKACAKEVYAVLQ